MLVKVAKNKASNECKRVSSAIVRSLGSVSSAPSLGPPSPLPNSKFSAPSPAVEVLDTFSLDESDSYCSIPEHGYQAKRMRADSPRPSPVKMFNRYVYPHHS